MNISGRTVAHALVMIACASSASLTAAEYRYLRVDPPGSTFTLARGVNARGDVVGTYTDANGEGHGFLLRGGVYSNVVNPAGDGLGPRWINAAGDIVGTFGDHGFLLTAEGVFSEVDYPGATLTQAFGINNAGDITGRYSDSAGHENGYILRNGAFSRYVCQIHARRLFGEVKTTVGCWRVIIAQRRMVGATAFSETLQTLLWLTFRIFHFPAPSPAQSMSGAMSAAIL